MSSDTNRQVAETLREIADLLEQQAADPFRTGAYRRAAATLTEMRSDLRSLFDKEGVDGLIALPGIGKGIAKTIVELLVTGRSSRLEGLRGALDPVKLFQTLPGVGPSLAARLHDHLQVDTLEALEVAAHDGRLESAPGIGPRRAAMIRAALQTLLGRRLRGHAPDTPAPSVADLLDVDAEYRDRADAGELPKIAPRRFNPSGEAWLPVLHTARGAWHFTALFSNTPRAHELGHTGDWVVVYAYDDEHHHETQHTVVTETHGALTGQRVVRGREAECRAYYGGHGG